VHWWGGHSYGPRLFSDMAPYLCYLLMPALPALSLERRRPIVWSTAFALCLLFSVFVNYRGAVAPEVYAWNAAPVEIDEQPARLWDWHDAQFLRGLRQ
jgi:hypothetical protein